MAACRKQSHIFQFLVTLENCQPLTWRRIQIPGDYHMSDLYCVISMAMNNAPEHYFQVFGMQKKMEIPQQSGSSSRANPEVNDLMNFDFKSMGNFGFSIVLEGVFESEGLHPYPRCIASEKTQSLEDMKCLMSEQMEKLNI